MSTTSCERCEDFAADARKVLSQMCAPDERHCSCVPHLRAEIERLTAELEEARLTLAVEQGRAEGAPSEGWVHYDDPTYGQIWEKRYDNGDIVRVGLNGIVHREMCRRKLASRYSTSRAAMLAADAHQ